MKTLLILIVLFSAKEHKHIKHIITPAENKVNQVPTKKIKLDGQTNYVYEYDLIYKCKVCKKEIIEHRIDTCVSKSRFIGKF